MKDELMRRISDAMPDPESDAALAALLEGDPDAANYAADLRRLDEGLGLLGAAGGYADAGEGESAVDWDAMANSIDAKLGALPAFDDIGDPTAPPAWMDGSAEDETVVHAASPSTSETAAPEPVLVAPASAPAPVVDLAARRRQRNMWIASVGGLAAAAAVALGLTAGMSLESDLAPAAESAAVADAPMATAFPDAEEQEESVGMGFRADDSLAAERRSQATETLANADPVPFAGEATGYAPAAAAPEPAPEALALNGALGSAGAGRRSPRRARARPTARTRGSAGGGASGPPLRNETFGPPPAPAPAARPSNTGTFAAAPDERAAQAALTRVTGQVRQCMGSVREVARIRVQVAASGRIQQVVVEAPFSGAAATCMTSVVQRVQLPTAASSYSIGHAYRPLPVAGSAGTGSAVGAAGRARRASPALEMSDDFK